MYKIIKAKPLKMSDVVLARYLQPFEKAGLVEELETEADILEFVVQIVNDQSIDTENFEHVLAKTHGNMLPSEIYQHLLDKDEYIPTIYTTQYDPVTKRRGTIRAVNSVRQLQPIVSSANAKGYINADYLGKYERKKKNEDE